ncbi:MAG: hypothetical protein IPL39_24590 [Opitutaceae bacterium]|nr:hypothetical protein [Opitutaceae bacterium]
MILHAIELTGVGRFRETVRVGPFACGLNILAAPNEAGKTTTLRAAARALFDKHTTKGEELKSLQPAGTDLAPRIAVEFETGAGRYRIEKTFLQSPRSLFKVWQSGAWQPVAEADAADQRVQDLLHTSLPGRGATRPEHWGFLGFLWARQGEPAAWPGLDDAAVGQRIRARLARVELDPVIERLRGRLGEAAEALFTSTGQVRVGGALRQAEDDLAGIETALAALRQTRTDLETVAQRHRQAEADVAQREREHAERELAAVTLRDQASAAERLRGELTARQQALGAAQEKLGAVAADEATLTKRQAAVTATQAALAAAEVAAQAAEQRLAQLRTRLDELQAARPEYESRLHALRAELQRSQALLKLRQFAVMADALARQVGKAEAAAAEIAVLEAKRNQLPALTPPKLRKLEELAESERTLRARLQALGLTVELTPEREARVAVRDGGLPEPRWQALPAGEITRLHSPQALDLTIEGWGSIAIRSGALEARNAASELDEAGRMLREALQETGLASVDAAREALAARREIEALLKAAQSALGPYLGEHATIEALRAAAAGAARRSDSLVTTVQPTGEEQALGLTEIEAAEARLTEAVPAAEKALKDFDRQLDLLRTDERGAVKAGQEAAQAVGEQRAGLRTLETQIADLVARYPEGLAAAKTAAQLVFVQAEARVAATKADLPPDFEKLPERSKRAAAALQQLVDELRALRTQRDQAKGTLETLGGQGLYSRETELEERKAEAVLRRDAARTRGWCARLAHDLIEHRKQAATRAALAPLEQRLTAALSEITGDTTRQVFLDEALQIAGLGRTREELYAFESLSQGTKEQLLLCLRIAVAQELAADEPQLLILDDVLVNTDPVRQERILDVLTGLSSRLQILILTCHPDRYRGVGQAIALQPVAP